MQKIMYLHILIIICTWEGEVDGPHPGSVHQLGGEGGGQLLGHAGEAGGGGGGGGGQVGDQLGAHWLHVPRHADEGGEVEGGHEEDEQHRLQRHGHLVRPPVHHQPVEDAAGAVEDGGDGAHHAEELVVPDEGLPEGLVVGRHHVGEHHHAQPREPQQVELLPSEGLCKMLDLRHTKTTSPQPHLAA